MPFLLASTEEETTLIGVIVAHYGRINAVHHGRMCTALVLSLDPGFHNFGMPGGQPYLRQRMPGAGFTCLQPPS